jgi:hypothetical protein
MGFSGVGLLEAGSSGVRGRVCWARMRWARAKRSAGVAREGRRKARLMSSSSSSLSESDAGV